MAHKNGKILVVQIAILIASVSSVASWAAAFPFPSAIVKPLLPPKLRWPSEQVAEWVESGDFSGEFLRYFARDPDRKIPDGDNLVSPADGVVEDIFTHAGTTYFVVGLSFWDVHVVRTPIAGTVTGIEEEGLHLDRRLHSSPAEMVMLRGKAAPVQQVVTLKTALGETKIHLITSYWASRLKVWVHVGQKLEKGERIGRILLGSTVAAEFPGGTKFAVRQDQRVVAGETIISRKDEHSREEMLSGRDEQP